MGWTIEPWNCPPHQSAEPAHPCLRHSLTCHVHCHDTPAHLISSHLRFKKKCAEEKLRKVQCMVKINCTVIKTVAPQPRWDTPTLEALRNEMVQALREVSTR